MINQLIQAVGTVLIIMAISIASTAYLWHLVKPTVEATELKYIQQVNSVKEEKCSQ